MRGRRPGLRSSALRSAGGRTSRCTTTKSTKREECTSSRPSSPRTSRTTSKSWAGLEGKVRRAPFRSSSKSNTSPKTRFSSTKRISTHLRSSTGRKMTESTESNWRAPFRRQDGSMNRRSKWYQKWRPIIPGSLKRSWDLTRAPLQWKAKRWELWSLSMERTPWEPAWMPFLKSWRTLFHGPSRS